MIKVYRGHTIRPGFHGPRIWECEYREMDIWIDCTECDQSIGFIDTVRRPIEITDDEARKVFAEHGWTVLPTRCPECLRKVNK